MSDRLSAARALQASLLASGCDVGTGCVDVTDCGASGLGLVATRPLSKGERLCSVPAVCCFSVSAARASPTLAPLLTQYGQPLREDDVLALLLLHEKGKGGDSVRAHHVAALPAHYDCTLFWSEEELQEVTGSPCGALTAALLSQTEADYNALKPLLASDEAAFPPHVCTLADYRWALATVWSRAMDLPGPNNETSERLVVPYLDFANQDASLEVCHGRDSDNNTVVLLAGRDYQPGEEVCINYGNLDAAAFLRLHGCVPSHAVVRVPVYAEVDPGSSDPLARVKRALLDSAGIEAGQPHYLTLATPLPHSLLVAARVLTLPPSSAGVSELVVDAVSVEHEVAALTALRDAVSSLQSAYPTSLTHDEALWATHHGSGAHEPSSRAACALALRLGEKRVLTAAEEELRRRLDDVVEAVRVREMDRAAACASAAPLQAYFQQLLEEEEEKGRVMSAQQEAARPADRPRVGAGLSTDRRWVGAFALCSGCVTQRGLIKRCTCRVSPLPPVSLKLWNYSHL